MQPDHFVKVFDVAVSGFRDWQFSAFGLIFVAVGLVIFLFPRIARAMGFALLKHRSILVRVFPYFYLGFSLIWTVTSFSGMYYEYLRHVALARDNACSIVEGHVESFDPMPASGHADESFSISGVNFRYSDYEVSDGFNNSAALGGPINKDSYVRICYDPEDHTILRLEIRDFKGPVKDYSGGVDLFPDSENVPNPQPDGQPFDIHWYSNLFVLLYFLDVIATMFLVRPYIRTFFTLKSVALQGCPIRIALTDGARLKLRNCIGFWDRSGHAIWLRGRGLNFFTSMLVIAKLETDAAGTSIIGEEIRFSSGFPLVMIAFFVGAYGMFSSLSPKGADAPPIGLFLGVAAIMFVVFGFISLGRLRKRMEHLAEDAMAELAEGPRPAS